MSPLMREHRLVTASVDSPPSPSSLPHVHDGPSSAQPGGKREPPPSSSLRFGYPLATAGAPWEAVKHQVAFHLCNILTTIEDHMEIVARHASQSSELFQYSHGILRASQRGHTLIPHLRLCQQYARDDIAQGLNDIFMVISGYADLSLVSLQKEVHAQSHCRETLAAVDRAKHLVQTVFTSPYSVG